MSLAALLIIPVVLCPLFLSIRIVLNIVASRPPFAPADLAALLLSAAFYSLALTYFWHRRTNAQLTFLYWLNRTGLWGALFGVLMVYPGLIAECVRDARQANAMELFIYAAIVPFTFGVIGLTAGGVAWLFLARTAIEDDATLLVDVEGNPMNEGGKANQSESTNEAAPI